MMRQKIPMFSFTTTLSSRSRPTTDCVALFPCKLSEFLISQLTVRSAVFIYADASMHKWHADESKAILDYTIRECLDN
jgi:hypothetical protein